MHRSTAPRTLVVTLALVLSATLPGRAWASGRPTGPGNGNGHRPVTGSTTHGNGRVISVLPDGSLRERCTAFTQVTESPFTIADRTTEVNVDAVSASWAKLDTIRSRGVDAGGIGVTRGLPGRWDAGVAIATWSGLDLTSGQVAGEVNPAGFAGGSAKLRHTFFGVDSAGAALGFVAAVRVPGSSSSPVTTSWEGSVALPFSAQLPFDVTLGAMVQASSVADAEATGHHLRTIESLKLEREVAPHLSGWIEGAAIHDDEPGHPSLAAVDGGLSADLFGHLDVSVGAAAGHSVTANDAGVFGGIGLHR